MTRRRGLKEAARDICEMSEVSRRRSSTYCMGKEMSYLTLKTDPVATAPGTDLMTIVATWPMELVPEQEPACAIHRLRSGQ